MKNYRKLLLEAIQAGNVAGILRGEKRYRIEPPTSVPDVFPTDICQEYNREHPTEMWLIYDAQKNSLDSRYSYEGRYDKDEELLPRLEFEKWFEEVKVQEL